MEKQLFHINELCVKVTDGSHFSPVESVDGNYPMFSVKDMEYNGFSYENCKYIDLETYKVLERNDCRPLKNDILIAKDGSYLKCVFKVKEDMDVCILSSIAILRPNVKVIDPDYFVYLLRTKSIKSAMASYVSGSALPRIILSDFKKMKLNLFENINYQKLISNTLIKYDTLIENNNNRIKLLENIAEELYKEWFVRFRFSGYKNTEFENGIPKSWRFAKLNDIALEVDKPINKENRYQYKYYVPIDCLPNKSMGLVDVDNIENAESSLITFQKKNILFGAMRPYFHKVIYSPIEGITRTTCFVLDAKNDLYREWLYLTMYQQFTVDFANTVSVGSTMPYVRWKDLNRMKVCIPSKDIIVRFNSFIQPILNKINSYFEINKNLIKQRDSLLPRLMSGKLSVEGKEII